MKNLLKFLILLFLTAFSFNNVKAQYTLHNYTKILDFAGATNGRNPWGSLITDNTYLYGMTTGGGSANSGTIFKIKISDNSYTKILDFTAETGSYPWGSLISDGTYLYGMTNEGGTNNYGTVFKIKISDNSFTKILDFDDANGSKPHDSLISDGTYLYGMTIGGGVYSGGVVFKIKISDNAYTKLLDFGSSNIGASPKGSLIFDSGYLYGMTEVGGTIGYGTIFKIRISDNTYTKIFNFDYDLNGGNPIGSLISDGTYLYGTTPYGGLLGSGVLFKIKISDNSYIKIFDYDPLSKICPYGSLISDGTYIYGLSPRGGSLRQGGLFKVKISDNTYTNILDFSGIVNGSFPNGSLIINDSYLYGMTTNGGSVNSGTVFKFQTNSPEINVKQNTTTITENTGIYNFGSVNLGASQLQTFTVENIGNVDLHLVGSPKVMISGSGFILSDDAPSIVSADGSATFTITFTPTAVGAFSGVISIENDAVVGDPYTFTVIGTGSLATGFVELSESKVTVYPNPANGIITISGLSAFKGSKDIQVLIIDILGHTKMTKTFKNQDSGIIDVSSLTNGTYFIRLQTDTEKIIKQLYIQ